MYKEFKMKMKNEKMKLTLEELEIGGTIVTKVISSSLTLGRNLIPYNFAL